MPGLGESAGALVHLPPDGDWEQFKGLLGTVFPISETERLFLGARHTLIEPPDRMGIIIWKGQQPMGTLVEDTGEFPGQPDVVVIRADDGAPPQSGLALGGLHVWEDVLAVGYPEDAVVPKFNEQGGDLLGIRGLKGYMTRPLEPNMALHIRAPAFELSFALPSGVSGGPLMVTRPGRDFASGLAGVCLANVETSYVLWHEEQEVAEGERLILQGRRVIEYGIAASLLEFEQELIPMVGKSLYEIMGKGPRCAYAVTQGLVQPGNRDPG